MDFDEVLGKRVSTRSYNEKKVSDDDIKKLLAAAYKAPIANGKYDSCRLTVITNKEFLDEIIKEYQKKNSSSTNPLYGAGLFILFSSNKETTARYEDAGCVLENISLKATDLGLGSCYIRGMVDSLGKDAAYTHKLGLDQGFYPVSGIVIGRAYLLPDSKDHTIETNRIRD